MFPRANEDVRRRLRLNVFKREYFIVGIDELRGNFFAADFAEQAIVHEGPSEYRVYSRKFTVESDSSVGQALYLSSRPVVRSRRITNVLNPSSLRNCMDSCCATSEFGTRPTSTR